MKRWAGRNSTYILIVVIAALSVMGGVVDHAEDLGWNKWEYSKR